MIQGEKTFCDPFTPSTYYLLQTDDPIAVIQKLQDFPQRENMYIENAYKKNQNEVKLEDTGMVVDLTTMKIYPKNQQTQQENVVRKEKFKGQSTILDAIAMIDILQIDCKSINKFFCNSIA